MLVNELMTESLLTVNEHDTLVRTRELMLAHCVRHMPVVDELETLETAITVGEVMNRDIVAVDENTDLAEAAQILLDHKFGCLPVLHDGYLTGILTDADFVKLVIDLVGRNEE